MFANAFALVFELLNSAPTLNSGMPPVDQAVPLTMEVRPLTLVKFCNKTRSDKIIEK